MTDERLFFNRIRWVWSVFRRRRKPSVAKYDVTDDRGRIVGWYLLADTWSYYIPFAEPVPADQSGKP